MNYNVDHKLLELEVFNDLKHNHRVATLLVLSFIKHWTTRGNDKYADFYQGKFSRDTGIGVKTIRLAEKRLIDAGLIKCIRLYQRVGNKPARYVSTLGIRSTKVRHPMPKGKVSDTKVNNYINNYNKKNNSSNKEFSSKLVVGSEEWFQALELKQKGKGK